MRSSIYYTSKNLINAILSVVTFILTLRVLFLLFSANQTTPFVFWVLDISDFLMAPFAGIVPNVTIATGVVDLVALITLLAYLIIGYLLISLLYSLARPEIEANEEQGSLAHYHDIEREDGIRSHRRQHG